MAVKLDSSTAEKKIDTLADKTKKLGDSFESAGKRMTLGLTVPLTAFGGFAVNSASDLEETMNKVDVAFKDNADEVKEWSKTSIQSFGMAQQTALDMTALYGDMATGMGVNTKEASKLGTGLTGLSGDLASFKNVRLDVAKTALAGVFTGETESLKQLGIIMTQTNLEQFALENGMNSNIDKMTEAEKIQLRYAFVVDRSKNAIGDFARTSDSTANQTRTATETYKEMSATFGKLMLPMVNKVLSALINLIKWFSSLSKETKKTILVITGIVTAIGPLLIIIGKLIKFIGKIGEAIKLIMPVIKAIGVFFASTFGAIVIAVGAVVGSIIWAIWYINKNGEAFSTGFSYILTSIGSAVYSSIEAIKNFFLNGFNWIYNNVLKPIFGFFTSLFNGVVSGISKGLTSIGDFFSNTFNWIKNNVLKPVYSFFADIFGGIWNIIKAVIDKMSNAFGTLKDVIIGIFTAISRTISNIFNAVGEIIKAPINGVVWAVNKALAGMNKIKVPDWVPGLGGAGINFPMIPYLATGTNNVKREGLAYLHQGEAVVPKKYNPAMGGGQNIVVQIPDIYLDKEKVGRAITPSISRTLRLAGAR